jgi:hypothetical protein
VGSVAAVVLTSQQKPHVTDKPTSLPEALSMNTCSNLDPLNPEMRRQFSVQPACSCLCDCHEPSILGSANTSHSFIACQTTRNHFWIAKSQSHNSALHYRNTQTPLPLVRKRTIPTDDRVRSANFSANSCG